MRTWNRSVFIACLVTCQGSIGVVVAQNNGAGFVSFSNDSRETDSDADQFLRYSIQARPVKIGMGKLALEKANDESIRDFGNEMMKAEDAILSKVKVLAAKRSVYLPEGFSTSYKNEIDDFDKETSSDFDNIFVSKMILILERDVSMLRNASECEDRWVRFLASEYLPTVELQLAQLKKLNEKSLK